MVYYEYETAAWYERSPAMEALIIGLLVVVLLGAFLLPEQQPPMVIYVGQEPTQSGDGWGCLLALALLGLLAVVLLSVGAQ
jgi:hypothetical protein